MTGTSSADFMCAAEVRRAMLRAPWNPLALKLAILIFDFQGLQRGRCELGIGKIVQHLFQREIAALEGDALKRRIADAKRQVKRAQSELQGVGRKGKLLPWESVLEVDEVADGRRATRRLLTERILEQWGDRPGETSARGGDPRVTPSPSPGGDPRVTGGVTPGSPGGCPPGHRGGDPGVTGLLEDPLEDLLEDPDPRACARGATAGGGAETTPPPNTEEDRDGREIEIEGRGGDRSWGNRQGTAPELVDFLTAEMRRREGATRKRRRTKAKHHRTKAPKLLGEFVGDGAALGRVADRLLVDDGWDGVEDRARAWLDAFDRCEDFHWYTPKALDDWCDTYAEAFQSAPREHVERAPTEESATRALEHQLCPAAPWGAARGILARRGAVSDVAWRRLLEGLRSHSPRVLEHGVRAFRDAYIARDLERPGLGELESAIATAAGELATDQRPVGGADVAHVAAELWAVLGRPPPVATGPGPAKTHDSASSADAELAHG